MKFLYEYRTKENELRSGSINASSRDEAFVTLKARGIRPARVTEAPGFFNKLFGKGKRWIAIVVLAALCVALAIVVGRDVLTAPQTSPVEAFVDSPVRRQLIGDAAIIEKGIATGWADAFEHEGERFFASFAIPGVPAGQRNTTEAEIREALERPTQTSATSIEARQIAAIVEGMKQECREFLSDGSTLAVYGKALIRRQEQEISYYQRAKAEIDRAWASKMPRGEFMALWERRNAQLRRIGVKLVPLPED